MAFTVGLFGEATATEDFPDKPGEYPNGISSMGLVGSPSPSPKAPPEGRLGGVAGATCVSATCVSSICPEPSCGKRLGTCCDSTCKGAGCMGLGVGTWEPSTNPSWLSGLSACFGGAGESSTSIATLAGAALASANLQNRCSPGAATGSPATWVPDCEAIAGAPIETQTRYYANMYTTRILCTEHTWNNQSSTSWFGCPFGCQQLLKLSNPSP